ncbi:hypothetical protein PVK06_011667 [Gossypium arboreum]|uniref:DUF4283 domain-containing protein n=1 Tax=Gossypium arboreum TaxID=29729 RepID=A0ABR0QAN5_GOSAR|nr:hypothetical protein PVK06_011667 [Gossypium arboreum]
MVITWIRLPGLPGHMYKKKILWEIGGMVGTVAKLDFNTDNGVQGRLARMAVYVNLGKALSSKALINGVPQRIEYEYLPTVYLSCGHYGHTQDFCPKSVTAQQPSKENFFDK